MKKISLLTIMLLLAMFAAAQRNITVTFKAENSDGTYQRLDSVMITDETQGWSQTLVYPDITMTLDYEDGIDEPLSTGGLSHNFPNPFAGSTEMVLSLEKDEQTCIRIVGMDGKILVERNISLPQGEHQINVSLDKPQLALIHVTTAHHSYTIKLLNIGEGGSNSIEVCKLAQTYDRNSKSGDEWFFALGDVMSYTGVAILDDGNVITSNTVTQALYHDDTITLVFDAVIPEDPQLPTVVTSEVSDITYTTAVCGGDVVNDGGAEVTERGVCWSTVSSPTINDNHTANGAGLGSFEVNIDNLIEGTTYFVRAYATNNVGTAYGNSVHFVAGNDSLQVPTGAINGLFSVSETTQVYFSMGILQYQASTNTWRFAENQWDYAGMDNANISETYSGWIDLFGWGTGNNPTITSVDISDYNTFTDWGINPISNGGNTANQWRTLTKDEWNYLLFIRSTTSGIRFAKAKVNNVDGVIILPDNWSTSYYTLNITNISNAGFSTNTITLSNWTSIFEVHGAVFFPATSYSRIGTTVDYEGTYGLYWSFSPNTDNPDNIETWALAFESFYIGLGDAYTDCRCNGNQVRLVRSSQN